MGGGGRSSGSPDATAMTEEERRRGLFDDLLGGEQVGHNPWSSADDIAQQLGVTQQEAEDMYDAIRGFTWGWDSVMRARQQGGGIEELKAASWKTQGVIDNDFGGDEAAYLAEVDKRIANANKLIELAPKWNGGELYRGYALSQDIVDEFTSGKVVNLNYGNASWTTADYKAQDFASGNTSWDQSVKFIAHTNQKRNGTSIRGLSVFPSEQEVYGSHKEAFVCTKTQKIGDYVHGWFDVVDYNHTWTYPKKK